MQSRYTPSILAKIFRGRKDVHAVQNLDLKAYHGQILCLLGPNGCGKSTTLNCISGDQKVTSGDIIIDSTGGLGYAPQKNMIWPDLTVEEHIRIFSDLKCLLSVNGEVIQDLAKGVDLQKKLKARAKTLSGGQMRKLQMAMMFAGGSRVCCVDEVSTGLDPISRRRIWEILLAERTRRTIIMTTHYLDEADYLADEVAIMYKGTVRASGTTASLKHSYGEGYTVKLPYQTGFEPQLSSAVQKEQSRQQTVYRAATPALAAKLIEQLEKQKLHDYQISGPTMEELFLKVTGDQIHAIEPETSKEVPTETKDHAITINVIESDYELTEGKPISAIKQWWILLGKRIQILKRRYIPYLVAVGFAIVGAGVAPLLIKSFKTPIDCPVPADLVNDYSSRNDFGSSYYGSTSYNDDSEYGKLYKKKYVFGPASRLKDFQAGLDQMAEVYSTNHTFSYYSAYNSNGYSNTGQIIEQLLLVDTYEEFQQAVQENWKTAKAASDAQCPPSMPGCNDYTPLTTLYGGVWVGDGSSKPTVLAPLRQLTYATEMTNFLTILTTGVPISVAYDGFAETQIPNLINFEALMFIIYYGLIMCW
jgi:ATP-binding cassette subfamily A (ABC1) protein 3